jgi:Ca-activated chloride channel homolog
MNRSTRWFIITLGIFALSALTTRNLRAQGAYAVSLAQVDTTRYPSITLYVNVRDASGNSVGGLSKDQFRITEDGALVEIKEFAGTGESRIVDIVFVFDTTISMDDEIEGVKRTCIAFAQKLKDQRRDYRLGLVAFGDEIRGVYKSSGDLTDNAEEFQGWISSLRATGGAGSSENDFAALKQASQMKFRANTQKIFILITDAPSHHFGDSPDSGVRFDDPDLTVERATAILKENAVTLYAITYDHSDFRRLAQETNGEFHELRSTTDFTGIIDKLGMTIAQQYRIVYTSPRPTYDGTRRNIVVNVGSGAGSPDGSGGGEYVEQHLVNFKSNILIAIGLLLPLLVALGLPVPFLLWQRQPASIAPNIPLADLGRERVAPGGMNCPRCAQPLRAGAKFCAKCGTPMATAAAPCAVSACPHCYAPMRPDANFCPRCGTRR